MGIPEIVQDPTELRRLFQADPVLIGEIPVDVLTLEVKTLTWTTTRRPVEAGLDVSDNRYRNPIQLRLEGWLTDTEISLSAAIGAAADALLGGQGFQFNTWQDKKAALEDLANSNEIFNISTRLDVYTSMQIDFLQVEHTKDTSGGYPFVLEATEIRTVSSQVVSVDPSQIPKSVRDKESSAQKEARGKKKKPVQGGKQAEQLATEKDTDPLRSLAQQLGFGV
jgi:hypothetical protein